MNIITVKYINARLTGFETSEKAYDYGSTDTTIEIDDIVLAGNYGALAIVIKVTGTNDETMKTTHVNRKTDVETPLIQTTKMNVDVYAKTFGQ